MYVRSRFILSNFSGSGLLSHYKGLMVYLWANGMQHGVTHIAGPRALNVGAELLVAGQT